MSWQCPRAGFHGHFCLVGLLTLCPTYQSAFSLEYPTHRENQSAEAADINTICKPRRPAGGFFCFGICANQHHKTFRKRTLLSWQLHPFWKGFVRLTGAILKQSNSTAQIRTPPWLNLRRKPEPDLLPLELDFLYDPTFFNEFKSSRRIQMAQ